VTGVPSAAVGEAGGVSPSGSARSNPALDIPNLLYRYADAIDAGRFDEAAALFDHGAVVVQGQRIEGREAIASMWRRWVRLYPDNTPRTRHLVTNPLIELADDSLTARCRSQWTLLQATDALPLQVVATGRYYDCFVYLDGRWHFTERRYAGVDLSGDMSAHLLQSVKGGKDD
jgi:3-phenylpropionate/cinnamic acid dioxygenase small subunit